MILEAAIWLLGRNTVLLSMVMSLLYDRPDSATVPLTPSVSTKSPTEKGLDTRIISPPARLDRVFCRASDTARPATLNRAMREVVWMPRDSATTRISTNHRPVRTMV